MVKPKTEPLQVVDGIPEEHDPRAIPVVQMFWKDDGMMVYVDKESVTACKARGYDLRTELLECLKDALNRVFPVQ